MLATETPSAPLERCAAYLFYVDGQDFLLVVDYRSRYREFVTRWSTSADTVICAIKVIFARHSVPQTFLSDNDLQFACQVFRDFSKCYRFAYITSRSRYSQSNGEAERRVRAIKDLFRKAEDPFLARLAYRNTPGVSRYSPAQLFMGRSLRTRLPVTTASLVPDLPQV